MRLPSPPSKPLNRNQLIELFKLLCKPAGSAYTLLRENESVAAAGKYSHTQENRVNITVMSGNRVLGRVNGAGRVYNARGNQIMGERLEDMLGGFGYEGIVPGGM